MTDFRQFSALIREAAQRHGASWSEALCNEIAALAAWNGYGAVGATWDDPGDAGSDDDLGPLPDRYTHLGVLGRGGMGRVLQVRDHVLMRIVAMKVCRADLSPTLRSRFLAEAQVTSQLEHPGIVPVYDLGQLDSGAPYYTMPVIRGRTLSEVVAEHHAGAPGAVPLRRLVALVHDVCAAMAHAHARGVIHRDLKPDNVMVGEHGEVLIVDWGLAKILGQAEPEVATGRTHLEATGTLYGTVIGTPSYMAPEQARGDLWLVDQRSDVHSLGALLFEVLTGRPPYEAETRFDTVARTLHDPVPRPRGPEELAELCRRALAKAPEERPEDAGALATSLQRWLDGAQRRERALSEVARAEALAGEIDAAHQASARLDELAAAALARVPLWAPAEAKVEAWRRQDEAAALRHEAEVKLLRKVLALRSALNHEPDLVEAHRALAAQYRGEHEQAELRGDRIRADQLELLLRTHDRGDHQAYLAGTGAVTLHTDPPGAEVHAYRYELRDRRLVPTPWARLGVTPVHAHELPIGSWLLVIRHPERAEVRYPVVIGRLQHWDGVPPGASEPLPVPLPSPTDLGADDRYVPPGWCVTGGDPGAVHPRPAARVWVDGFVARRHPVTNAEVLVFLQALGDEAEAHAPGGGAFHRDPSGRWVLGRDAEGDVWQLEWPASMVTWSSAQRYAAWERERSGLPWRLPHELEWEKAARGVDGRTWPWGDHFDPSLACTWDSHAEKPGPWPVGQPPGDRSVYGVAGAVGGVSEWCLDLFDASTNQRILRGSNWAAGARMGRLASRMRQSAEHPDPLTGFRLFRPWPS